MNFALFLILLSLVTSAKVIATAAPLPCRSRHYGDNSHVCVCDANYCDTIEPYRPLPADAVIVYTSSQDGKRFQKSGAFWGNNGDSNQLSDDWTSIEIDISKTRQEILGFGSCFTDTTGMVITSLPNATMDLLMRNYFSPSEGIGYTVARIPMASTDFGTRQYTYADKEGDMELEHFALAEEDHIYKIPLIHRAQELTGDTLRLFASPWTAPAWMKTNNALIGKGTIRGEMGGTFYRTWANYFVKFIEAYEANYVPLWGLTVQNEPSTGFWDWKWQTTGFTDKMERDFVKMNLGPTLNASGNGHLKLMIMDDQRFFLPGFATTVYSDPEASKYVAGTAVHWYWDFISPGLLLIPVESFARVLSLTHERHPDKFLLMTEACTAWMIQKYPRLGSWDRADSYAHDIIMNLNNYVTGWVDWNLALDLQGGPSWVPNYVDAPIIVNKTAGEFYKQPMFYAMGHFSRFIPRGSSVLVVTMSERSPLFVTAAVTPESERVVVILNRGVTAQSVLLKESVTRPNEVIRLYLDPKSVTTVIWKL